MSAKVNRSYHSPQRAQQANATRRAVLDAANRLFSTDGYGRTTMDAVAEAAGLSVATVYLLFRTKLGLISALVREATEDPALDVRQVLVAADVEAKVRVGAGLIRQLHERTSGIVATLRAGVGNDSGLEALWHEWQARHLAGVERVASHLAATHNLRPGLAATEAADVLYVLAGAETYRELVVERGWSPAQFEEWLAKSIRGLVVRSA